MKKMIKIIATFIISLIIISCQKDKTAPIINIDSQVYNEMQVLKGDTIKFLINATDDAGIRELKLQQNSNTVSSSASSNLSYNWITSESDSGMYHFTIRATDNEGNTSEKYLDLYLNEIRFIFVEGGTFQMGSEQGKEDNKPVHEVLVNSFEIMAREATIGQFVYFLNQIDCPLDGYYQGKQIFIPRRAWFYNEVKPYLPWEGTSQLSIEYIPWEGAQALAEWMGGRLPTEAEWEYAARGGKLSQNYLYSGSNNINEVAWYKETPPVEGAFSLPAKFAPNELGLYDMSGNLREWCYDIYDKDYYQDSPYDNPIGPDNPNGEYEYRVLRGGSRSNNADSCTVFNRNWDVKGFWNASGMATGFRIVKDIK